MPTLVVVDRYFTVASIFSRTQASAYTAQTAAKCTEFDPPPASAPGPNHNHNPTLHNLYTEATDWDSDSADDDQASAAAAATVNATDADETQYKCEVCLVA